MSPEMNNRLYENCKKKRLEFKHVCEVGVYMPQTSNIISFIKDNVRTTLVEPDPKSIEAIKSYFIEYRNIKLYQCAVFDHKGTLELIQRDSSTFVSSLKASPALVNDQYKPTDKDKFTVNCVTFDEIDDGSIDLLSVDTEGCEWYVMKNLKSRPAVISLETHGKVYLNPYYPEICRWIKENGYTLWYKDGSDSVYFRTGLFELSASEKFFLVATDTRLLLRKQKHKIKRRIKKILQLA